MSARKVPHACVDEWLERHDVFRVREGPEETEDCVKFRLEEEVLHEVR